MPSPHPSRLRRIVSLGFGVAIIVGGTIGVGIMRMPAVVAGYTSNPFLFIFFWILGGFIAMVGASVYAELGTRMPYAGGPFVFAQQAFGNELGFLTGCCDWFFQTGAMSYLSIAIAEYVCRLMGWNLPLGISATLITIVFVLFQWQGLKSSSNFQKIMSVVTALCLFLFVGACFVYFFTNTSASAAGPRAADTLPVMAIFILSIRSVFMTFTGWNCAVYFVEEDTNPGKNVPRALFTGVASVTIIFTLINLGLLAVLPLPVMAQTNLPAADAAQVIFGGSGGNIVTIISIILLVACLAATALIAQRVLFAISRRGLFFSAFSKLNKHQIPGNALLLTAGVSIIFSLTGIFNVVVNVAALFALLADLGVYVSILIVRRQAAQARVSHGLHGLTRIIQNAETAETLRRDAAQARGNALTASLRFARDDAEGAEEFSLRSQRPLRLMDSSQSVATGLHSTSEHYHSWLYPYGALFMIAVSLCLVIGLCIEDTRNCMYAVILLMIVFPFYLLFRRMEGGRASAGSAETAEALRRGE